MVNVILPVAYWLLSVGDTVNMRNYAYSKTRIYNDSDTMETPVNSLNSTYYVLQGNDAPNFGTPIDMIIRCGKEEVANWFNSWIGLDNCNAAEFVTVTEFLTTDIILKVDASPQWQNISSVPSDHTHYVDKKHYGGRIVVRFTVTSNVSGDIQVLRRILIDVMGKSGNVGEDIAGLYRKAVKAMRESEDIRGKVHISHGYRAVNIDVPLSVFEYPETLLKSLNELAKNATVSSYAAPLYVSYKPLHDLDERFPSVEKNVVSEEYLVKLYNMVEDLDRTHGNMESLTNTQPEVSEQQMFREFEQKVHSVREDARKLLTEDVSIFKNVNVSVFQNVFQEYQNGLDNSTETYREAFLRLREQIGVRCENRFLSPTRGSLIVEKNEIKQKGETESLTECQNLCLEDARCRAVGYDETNKQCVIYYRSTYSARIHFQEESSSEFKVYDRVCPLL